VNSRANDDAAMAIIKAAKMIAIAVLFFHYPFVYVLRRYFSDNHERNYFKMQMPINEKRIESITDFR
jgi:hypothetical protein